MSDIAQLESQLAELRGEKGTVESQMTQEDLDRKVGEWLDTARAHATGASRIVLAGQASGDQLAQVLYEDRLDDDGLVERLVARLKAQGFGQVSDKAKAQQVSKLEAAIGKAEKDLLAAQEAAALEALRADFAAKQAQITADFAGEAA